MSMGCRGRSVHRDLPTTLRRHAIHLVITLFFCNDLSVSSFVIVISVTVVVAVRGGCGGDGDGGTLMSLPLHHGLWEAQAQTDGPGSAEQWVMVVVVVQASCLAFAAHSCARPLAAPH